MSLEEDIKLLREEGGPRSHVMSWKYFTGDITSRAVHLYKYPDVSSNQLITLNRIKNKTQLDFLCTKNKRSFL